MESQGFTETQTPPNFCLSTESQTKRYQIFPKASGKKKTLVFPHCVLGCQTALPCLLLTSLIPLALGLPGDRDLIPGFVNPWPPLPGTPIEQDWDSLESDGHKLTLSWPPELSEIKRDCTLPPTTYWPSQGSRRLPPWL